MLFDRAFIEECASKKAVEIRSTVFVFRCGKDNDYYFSHYPNQSDGDVVVAVYGPDGNRTE